MKIIQQKNYNKVNTFTRNDGTTTDPGGETLTELVEVHFPNAVEKIKKSYTSNNKMKKQNIEESNKKWINFSLTKEALLSFDNKKAAGPDEIKPVLFEYMPDNFIRHLVFIYKCVIKLRYTPLLWKDTKVIFYPEAG